MSTDPATAPSSGSVSAMTLDNYRLPAHRLQMQQREQDRIPLVLVACGSFSPVTILHLRLLEMGRDHFRMNTQYEVVGGYFSPVSDVYRKNGLAPSHHRVRMCELATEESPDWIMVDPWEALQPRYTPTAAVLDHIDHEINHVLGGIKSADGQTKRPARIMLLAGADLIATMSTPGVWAEKDLDHIFSDFGTVVVERSGIDMEEALSRLKRWEDNIIVVPQLIANDVSSTKIRLLLKRDMSVKWMIPHSVDKYIKENGLYTDEADQKEKQRQEAGTS